uniref:BHLH domain-containing protein n=1 Tax=Salix viminalis TaxID=40686 RepID=A0A6N2KXG1_SALVM
MEMGADLHNTLRSLCFNTDWNYAVFWKLKHRARMVLTWEDGYYENCELHDAFESKCFSQTQENLHGGHYTRDLLGLAVAKMSYHVYSLGEGIVGQVAVSGKHQWIFADKYAASSFSSNEFSNGWQSQFSAGIKTIVAVAVMPYGVVQLGSLNKVIEDVNLVTCIQDVFFALQASSVRHVNGPLQHSMNSALCPKTAAGLRNKQQVLEISTPTNDESIKLLHLRSNASYLDHQSQPGMNIISDQMYGGESNVWKDLGRGSEHNVTKHLNSFMKDKVNPSDLILPNEKFGADFAAFPADLFDATILDRDKSVGTNLHPKLVLDAPESSNITFKKDLEKKLDHQAESTHLNASDTFFKFSAGCELLEALGPSFLNRCMPFDYQAGKSEAVNGFEMPEGMSSNQMTFEFGSENLLEAVVGNACHSGSDVKSEKSGCKSVQSLLTVEKLPEPSIQNKRIFNSASCSINQSSVVEEDAQNFSNSTEVCGGKSPKGFLSTCPSICNEQLDKHTEPAKNSRKRAKPGEKFRPRPRDRQLIQDRIKELRELVPSGSKCSIDSLLEQTIKHMLFLDSITKHADKLNKCAEPKMHQKETDASNYEQGSSWAVEVGSHLKVSSIIVENLNKNGQMLVEMLCEECNEFLEIAEAIRSLGLTILKGITEVHGEKTWICFVVEGQNNRIMHRMDILWSLVQILQPKTTN